MLKDLLNVLKKTQNAQSKTGKGEFQVLEETRKKDLRKMFAPVPQGSDPRTNNFLVLEPNGFHGAVFPDHHQVISLR